ncbi:MAG TPA: 16S rRNA (guanine(966)-N(2))-methyltransferase RsmD [Desulfurivibrionaceae bacterium]|nr:16S rRNA (guanine(966)-N(2))-methyltransferase RsmD [Desulfurivibrionaceae bacterium]
MRIIGGSARGRRLITPGRQFGQAVRPTSDRAREALFNILRDEVVDRPVLELFAGTGALGLEALSRGATSVLFVEGNRSVADLLQRNIDLCGFRDRARVLVRDLAKGLTFLRETAPENGFGLILLDPPYASGLAEKVLTELASLAILKSDGLVVAEIGRKETLPEQVGPLRCLDRRRYGEAVFWFYHVGEGQS